MGKDRATKEPRDVIAEQWLEKIDESLRQHLDLQITTLWMQQYRRLDEAVTPDAVKSMKAILHEFITEEQYKQLVEENGLDGIDKWTEQLLMTQRIYEYLLFVNGFVRTFPAPDRFPDGEFAARRWLRELCWNREFRMVHIRQGGFYPGFTRLVNTNLLREARRAASSAEIFQRLTKSSETRKEMEEAASQAEDMIDQAQRMRDCANLTAAAVAYEELVESEGSNSERYDLVHETAGSHNRLPLNSKNFIRLWFSFPEVREHFPKAVHYLDKTVRDAPVPASGLPN